MKRWADREPDETVEDWMLRVQIGLAVIEAHRTRETAREAS